MSTTVSINIQCPHCGQSVPSGAFCDGCRRILPAQERSHWAALGYDRDILNVDAADLEKRFFDLSRKFHPDRFANRTALEVRLSHEHSSAINNAYRTLKDPVARAAYMVEQKLGSISEKSAQVPPDMAEMFFEIQDHLDEIRHSGGAHSESAVAEVRKAEVDLRNKVRELESGLRTCFLEYDAAPDTRIVEQMKELLAERSYVTSFLRQIESVMTGEQK